MESAAQIADRLAALNAAANRHGSDHELSAVCSHLHSELPKLLAATDYLRLALWACFQQAGGDTDGDREPHMTDESLISSAVEAVKSLREEYDEACEELRFDV